MNRENKYFSEKLFGHMTEEGNSPFIIVISGECLHKNVCLKRDTVDPQESAIALSVT